MPWTPDSSTWSAELERVEHAETCRSLIDSSRSFGMTMRVSTSSRSASMPVSACVGAAAALEGERAGDDADGQRAERAGDAGDDGRAAGAGAAALARGDEDHVGALEDLLDLLRVVLGGLAADLGVGAGAEPAGELAADVELDVGVAHQQRLRVGVDRDELDALEPDLDHAVDGVDAAAADADDLDDREVVLRCCHVGCLSLAWPWGAGDPHPQVEGYSYVNQLLVCDRTWAAEGAQRPRPACRQGPAPRSVSGPAVSAGRRQGTGRGTSGDRRASSRAAAGRAGDVTRPEGQDDVPGGGTLGQPQDGGIPVRLEDHPARRQRHGAGDQLPVTPGSGSSRAP